MMNKHNYDVMMNYIQVVCNTTLPYCLEQTSRVIQVKKMKNFNNKIYYIFKLNRQSFVMYIT